MAHALAGQSIVPDDVFGRRPLAMTMGRPWPAQAMRAATQLGDFMPPVADVWSPASPASRLHLGRSSLFDLAR
jgi:hypothetical protein